MKSHDSTGLMPIQPWRLDAIIRATCLCLLASMAIVHGLFIRADRVFGITPLLEVLRHVPQWTDWPMLGAVSCALCWQIVFVRARWPLWIIIAANGYWACQDLERIQPYFYLYCFVLFLCLARRRPEADPLPALRLTVSSFYFWAGAQKLNMTFVAVVFPWFVGTLTGPAPGPVTSALVTFAGLGAGLFEIAVGFFLLVPRLRLAALVMAWMILIVALLCLGPFGRNYNTVVWPLNIYVVFLDMILFRGFFERGIGWVRRFDPAIAMAFILFTLGPLLSGFNISPLFASLKLYAGNTPLASVRLADDEDMTRVPASMVPLLREGKEISLHDWTMSEFASMLFTDDAVFHSGSKGLCPYLSDPENAVLRIYSMPDRWTGKRTFEDFPLCDEVLICLPPAGTP